MTGKLDQDWIRAYDAYTHEHLDRRRFVDRMVQVTGGTAAATAAIAMLENNYAKAAIVPPEDERLTTERVSFAGADGTTMTGYLAMPADATAALPGIVVIHENRGLNAHIEDVARRAAIAGFVALAPDFLSPAGGTPDDEDEARDMIRELDGAATLENAVSAVRFLEGYEATTDAIGVTGFCWGGALTNRVATAVPDLGAAVAWYGGQPSAEAAARIDAPLMLHYAGLDERINAGIPDYREALEAAGVDYTIHMYEGVNHAFHNDTNEARYDQAAAELAWERTIAFFEQHLGESDT